MPHLESVPEPEPAEILDALPVVVPPAPRLRRLEPPPAQTVTASRGMPIVQAAAFAAGSFAAGAVAAAVVHRRVSGSPRALRRAHLGLPIVASRSFLVDVHLLDPAPKR